MLLLDPLPQIFFRPNTPIVDHAAPPMAKIIGRVYSIYDLIVSPDVIKLLASFLAPENGVTESINKIHCVFI